MTNSSLLSNAGNFASFGALFPLVVNTIFDIGDVIKSRKVTDINANVIELACVVTDDLPTDIANQYCKSLEVLYATLVRAILQSSIRNRFNAGTKDLFRSLPILTNFDSIKFDRDINAISSISKSLFSKNKDSENGSTAVNAFLENVRKELDEKLMADYGLEADVFLQEQRGGVPTFVDVSVTITNPGGRAIEKQIPVGISVRPKKVSPQEMISFFIKQNNKLADIGRVEKIKAKRFSFKSLLNKKRIENKIDGGILDNNSKKVLSQVLESTKNVDKPFVCLLISNYTKDLLADAKVDITKPDLMRNIYGTLPIMSISIYDMNLDMVHYSLSRSQTSFVSVTASSFNTDVSQLQKTLAEGLRVSKMLG